MQVMTRTGTALLSLLLFYGGAAYGQDGASILFRPTVNYRNVEATRVVAWLKWLRVPVPFAITGTMSVNLEAGVPTSGLNDGKRYELDGTLESPALTINGITLRELRAVVRYRNGVMQLSSLRFRLDPRPGETKPTLIGGSGTMPLLPRGDLTLDVDVADLTWSRIDDWLDLPQTPEGTVSGKATASIAGGDVARIEAWSVDTSLASNGFSWFGIQTPTLDFDATIRDRKLTVTRLSLTIDGEPISFSGAIAAADDYSAVRLESARLEALGGRAVVSGAYPLTKPAPQRFELAIDSIDAHRLAALVARRMKWSVPDPTVIAGAFSADGEITVPFGSLTTITGYRTAVTLRSATLRTGALGIADASARVTFDGRRLAVDPVSWKWATDPADAVANAARLAADLSLLGRVEGSLDAKRVPVGTIAKLFKIDAAGLADGRAEVSLPTWAIAVPSSWKFTVDLTGTGLRYGELPAELTRVRASLLNNTLDVAEGMGTVNGVPVRMAGKVGLVENVEARLNALAIEGEGFKLNASGNWPLANDRWGKLAVTLDRLTLAAARSFAGLPPVQPKLNEPMGELSGKIDVDLAQVDATGDRPVMAAMNLAGMAEGQARIASSLNRFRDPMSWTTGVDIRLNQPFDWGDHRIEGLSAVIRGQRGTLDITELRTTLDAVPFSAKGRVHYRPDRDAVEIERLDLELFSGSATASGTIGLSANPSHDATATFADIDAAAIEAIALPAVKWIGVQGRLNGTATIRARPADDDRDATFAVQGSLATAALTVRGVRLNDVKASGDLEDGVASIAMTAGMHGGTLNVSSRQPLMTGRVSDAAFGTRVTLQNIPIERITALAGTGSMRGVTGRASLQFASGAWAWDERMAETFRGNGNVEFRDVAYGGKIVARVLRTDVSSARNALAVRGLSGDLLGGTLRGTAASNFVRLDDGSTFDVRVERANLAAAAALVGLPGYLTGEATVNLRGRMGLEVTASGQATGSRLHVLGLGIDTWTAPLDLRFRLADGSGRLRSAPVVARLAEGQLRSDVSLEWSRQTALKSTTSFNSVSLPALLRAMPSVASAVPGKISGQISLDAKALASVNDLTGRFQIALANVQAGRLPVFDRVLPLVGGSASTALTFNDGSTSGAIGRGTIIVEKLDLASPQLKVFAEGRIRMEGRLDLNVHAATGSTPLVASQIPGINTLLESAVPPLALYSRVNRLLADRVIAAKVTGTIKSPTVQIQPLPTLTREGLRFLMGEYYPAGTIGKQ